MKYTKVFIETIEYELAPNIITSDEIEDRLESFYQAVGFEKGQIELLTGIKERRFWDIDHKLADHAAKAGQKAIEEGNVSPDNIGALVYCGVCQDGFEPATSCAVANQLSIGKNAHIYDVKNACLGAITGMVQVANEIELGNIKAGLVVSCESARQIVNSTIDEINTKKDIEFYKKTIATMTGGSGAVAILLTDGTIGNIHNRKHLLKGGVVKNATRFHDLCYWGFVEHGMPTTSKVIMRTQGDKVLKNGLPLVVEAFTDFLKKFNLIPEDIDKIVGHQIGSMHHQAFYGALGIDMKKDFATYPFLGNTGSIALPITAAIADERGFLEPNDLVGFIGVGSGLNAFILGVEW